MADFKTPTTQKVGRNPVWNYTREMRNTGVMCRMIKHMTACATRDVTLNRQMSSFVDAVQEAAQAYTLSLTPIKVLISGRMVAAKSDSH